MALKAKPTNLVSRPGCLSLSHKGISEYFELHCHRRPFLFSGEDVINHLLLHSSEFFSLPVYVGLNIHAFFYWNDSCVAVTLGPHSSLFKCISKNSANQTIKLAISLHSHQLGNQQRACFPNEPLAALILETVPIKLVTRHHPKHKNHWDSRSLLGFFLYFFGSACFVFSITAYLTLFVSLEMLPLT